MTRMTKRVQRPLFSTSKWRQRQSQLRRSCPSTSHQMRRKTTLWLVYLFCCEAWKHARRNPLKCSLAQSSSASSQLTSIPRSKHSSRSIPVEAAQCRSVNEALFQFLATVKSCHAGLSMCLCSRLVSTITARLPTARERRESLRYEQTTRRKS